MTYCPKRRAEIMRQKLLCPDFQARIAEGRAKAILRRWRAATGLCDTDRELYVALRRKDFSQAEAVVLITDHNRLRA